MLIKKINQILDLMLLSNKHTYEHLERTALFSFALAKALNLNPKEMEMAYFGGLLHDIGKLNGTEQDIQERHVVDGSLILKFVDGLESISEVILHHHEQWNGEGYPNKLSGTNIPLISRVISIANDYDKLRNFKGLTHNQAVAILRENAGKIYDPDMVEPFISIIEKEELF